MVEKKQELKKISVGFYPEEIEAVKKILVDDGQEIEGDLSGKDIRVYFELNPTHHSRVKTELKEQIADMTDEEQKALLEKLKNKE